MAKKKVSKKVVTENSALYNFAARSIVIPSTKLKVMGVHKLQDHMTCARMYFWKWIYNLISVKPNYNFWFGSMAHCGAEELNKGTSEVKRNALIRKTANRALTPFGVDPTVDVELSTQIEIVILLVKHLEIFLKTVKGRTRTNPKNEQRFKIRLNNSDVWLVGTLDSYDVSKSKIITMEEYKTALQVNNFYFQKIGRAHV